MRVALFVACCAIATTAHAQFTGTIRGVVRATSTRVDPYSAAGYLPADLDGNRQTPASFGGGVIPLQEALIELQIQGGGGSQFGVKTVFARTNAAGLFVIPWNQLSRPDKLRVRVIATRPSITATQVVFGFDREFRITTAGVSDVVLLTIDTVPAANTGGIQDLGTSTLPASEVTNAFLTVRETYAMFDTNSVPAGGSIRGDMEGLNIFVNEALPIGSFGGGVAPAATEVLLVPGTATSFPFTVAHEVGHIVSYRAYGVPFPPAGPPTTNAISCLFWEHGATFLQSLRKQPSRRDSPTWSADCGCGPARQTRRVPEHYRAPGFPGAA